MTTAHFSQLIGQSAVLQQLLNTAALLAATDVTVLIEGATGTGKELLARALHQSSPRSQRDFVAVNCASLPEGLVESQLFGHRKGAFTGADQDHKGFVQQAEGGTLFLDEVGELSLAAQARLLRFIEYGECQRLGDSQPGISNVRILAATNRDLQQQVQSGEFREDLYFRLRVVPLELPTLAQRIEDVPVLAAHFIQQIAAQYNLPAASLSREAIKRLQGYSWPGNVRELRNLCESLVVLLQGKTIIEASNLPAHISADPLAHAGFKLPASGIKLDELEVDLLQQALQASAGNKSRAARLLGISRDVFLYRLKKYAIA
jgi:DNA-binding NtrC family response regulator